MVAAPVVLLMEKNHRVAFSKECRQEQMLKGIAFNQARQM